MKQRPERRVVRALRRLLGGRHRRPGRLGVLPAAGRERVDAHRRYPRRDHAARVRQRCPGGTSAARSGPITPGDGPLSIGGNSIWGEWFKGVIDEVRVYDRPLVGGGDPVRHDDAGRAPRRRHRRPSAAQVGSWTAPQAWPMVAVHASMLSDGKVVAWDAFGSAPQSEHVWDPETGQFVSTPSGINLFCSGHVLLPDGRLFVAGGHELPYAGLRNTMLFSPTLGSWTPGPDMARGRWYPTTTTLPDGRVLIVSGDGIRPGPNDPFFVRPSDTIPELYDPKTNTIVSVPSAGRLMPLYPFMFVAPDGRVVDAGPDTTTRLLDVRHRPVGDTGEPLADHRRQRGHVPARQGPQDRHLDRHRLRPADDREQVGRPRPRPDRAGLAFGGADEVGAHLPHAHGAAGRRRAGARRPGRRGRQQPSRTAPCCSRRSGTRRRTRGRPWPRACGRAATTTHRCCCPTAASCSQAADGSTAR